MLRIGWGSRNIVPQRPAMLMGQMHTRVAHEALDPLTVTAMAIDGGAHDGSDGVILVSCDLALISDDLQEAVRRQVSKGLPSLPADNIILFATHTHTSLVCVDGFYPHPGGDVMTAQECSAFLADRIAQAAVEAWQGLAPCSVGRAYGHAVVGHNRRPVYTDGTAQMYGRADRPDFQWIEGYEDHSFDMLFVWDASGALAGVVLNIPCPSQVDEGLNEFSADFWHEIRVELRKRLGEKLWVLPICGISGDQSPHFILYKNQEEEMRKRRGFSERQEIAMRVADAVERALACTRPMEGEVALAHQVHRVTLSPRRVSRQERDWAEAEHQRAAAQMDPKSWWPQRLQLVVDIFEGRHKPGPVPAELHFLRLGDAVLATNPFELFVDFGLRIKERSPAAQTLLTQLTSGVGWYLPTKRAVEGGGYGAMPAVCAVGPEGGDELVEHTVKGIAELFAEK